MTLEPTVANAAGSTAATMAHAAGQCCRYCSPCCCHGNNPYCRPSVSPWSWRRHVPPTGRFAEYYGDDGRGHSATVTRMLTGWQARIDAIGHSWSSPYYASAATAKRYAERQFPS